MFKSLFAGILAMGIVLFEFGCQTTDSTKVTAQDFNKRAEVVEDVKAAELIPGDFIEVSVEVDGRMEVQMHRSGINYLGLVTLPLVGDVKVSGMSLQDARAVIAKKYGTYFVNTPLIMVSRVDDSSSQGEWGFVTVTGRVGQPGRVKIMSAKGIRLTAVIQESGGFGPSAKKSDIQISRINEDGQKIRTSVNYEDIGQSGNLDADVNLFDGDIVYVPERMF
ncbi:polysaccharide biosynthesis/export family protein [Pontiellaceae bacterium B12219]|nr:polysaccharide biosynthesis/export family protein [Pontiellaceae bacterium B12219]